MLVAACAALAGFVLVPICWPHYLMFSTIVVLALVPGIMNSNSRVRATGALVLVVAATWSSRLLVGGYVDRYGFTAAVPVALWAVTSAALVFNLAAVPLVVSLLHTPKPRRPASAPGPPEHPQEAMRVPAEGPGY